MGKGKLLVFSDVHGDSDGLKTLLSWGKGEMYDIALNLGDLEPDAEMETLSYNIVSVKGNMDRYHYFTLMPDPPGKRKLTFDGKTVFLIHDGRAFPYDAPFLKPGDIYISGHTHVPELSKTESGIFKLNPGSLSRPRSKKYGKTFISIEDGKALLLSFPAFSILEELPLEL